MKPELDVLARAEAERFLVVGKVEGITAGVFAKFFPLLQMYGDPAVSLESAILIGSIGGFGKLFGFGLSVVLYKRCRFFGDGA